MIGLTEKVKTIKKKKKGKKGKKSLTYRKTYFAVWTMRLVASRVQLLDRGRTEWKEKKN